MSQAVGHGIPISLAIDRANKFFPPADRPTPQDLSGLLGISKAAGYKGYFSIEFEGEGDATEGTKQLIEESVKLLG